MFKYEEFAKSLVESITGTVKPYIDKKVQDVADMVKAIPAPQKGDPGEPVDMAEVQRMVKEAVAQVEMPKFEMPDVTKLVSQLVASEVQKQVNEIEIPAPKDGIDGEPGRDAVAIEILSCIEDKSYPRGTYALHKGGLWRTFQKSQGMHGWECVVNGISDIAIEQTSERSFSVTAEKSCGELVKKDFTIPAMIYRGTYEHGKSYEKGDTTTWNGSTWTCLEDTDEAPNSGSKKWQLSVKAGRNANQPVKVPKHA